MIIESIFVTCADGDKVVVVDEVIDDGFFNNDDDDTEEDLKAHFGGPIYHLIPGEKKKKSLMIKFQRLFDNLIIKIKRGNLKRVKFDDDK